MDNVIISGYAKLPAHITSEEVYKVMVLAAVIDMEEGTITEAEPSMVTNLTRDFIAKMMVGYNMNNGPELLLDRFERTYYGNAKRALETCLKMIFSKYEEVKQLRELKRQAQG